MNKNNEHDGNVASERNKTNTDEINTGEAAVTVGGGAVGAVVGSALGPVGTIARWYRMRSVGP